MEAKHQGITRRGLNTPHLVFSQLNTADSDTSLSPSEFERMINTNFPQFLAAVDDIGFESMRSDSTNITSAGLNTLYLQAKSTSTPSILADLSLSESTKKAINKLEQCLRDIGPESGIGISPADLGDCSSSANNHPSSNHILAPLSANGSQEKKPSLHSSFEMEDEDAEEAYRLSVYTTPENRVERQLYSLDGNRRSSFESVYSPNIVTEQVVNEVIQLTPPKAIILPQDDKPVEKSNDCLNGDDATPLATSVTTSISAIISSPSTETTIHTPSNEEKQIHKEVQDADDAADADDDNGKDDETNTFTPRSDGAPEEGYIPLCGSQSKQRDEKDERCGLITSVVAVSVAGGMQQSASAKVVPKPRLQSNVSKSPSMALEDDNEWAKKVRQIAQWQAEVNLAMQGANNGPFIGLPLETFANDELSNSQPPKPLRRRYMQQNLSQPHHQQQKPTMVSLKTFEYRPNSSSGNNTDNMPAYRLKPTVETQHFNKTYGCNISDDMFSRRFGGMQNHVYNQTVGSSNHQTMFPIPPPSCPRYPKMTSHPRANVVFPLNEPSMQNDWRLPASRVDALSPCPRLAGYSKDVDTSCSPNYSSKYAEALSLATAANTAVTEAFNSRARLRKAQPSVIRETSI